ncbi:phage head morphogenesis protein, partial [Desulfosarcina sp. OttesenSCG-928-G10]|nr:phage head morphogenesis protein [Desulfosarcina sp. OttesenSCG-928-G10]
MKLEPREAISFWNSKTCLLPDQFSKLTDDEKFLAFTVSGIPKIKSIKTVHKAILSAIKNGDTSQEFNKNMRAVVEPAGWTKEEENRRLDNIFRTNIQTAFNVGRYRQMMKVKEARPFWRYNAVNDSRTRPTHRAVNGKIFRFDHPFWDKWYPPNGFRCRCNVRTLSQREIDRDGLTVETQDPIGRLMNITTPDGIVMSAIPLMPDPGFAFNPGKIFWGNRVDGAASPATWT